MSKYDMNANSVMSARAKKKDKTRPTSVFDPGLAENDASRVAYEEIDVNRITPRSINRYKQNRIDRLAKSIHNTNDRLIHPIVLVRAQDLPVDSEVIEQFRAKGVDPETLDYIIVSGERRYRAWMKLREEENEKHKGLIGEPNKFDTITANVLSRKEAKSEEAFFEDSNLEARQLTPLEGILHIRSALEEVQTTDQKRQALIEMASGDETSVPVDDKKIERKFNEEKYCEYYLSAELGIEDWSSAKIKKYHALVKKCSPVIIDALIDGKFVPDFAFRIRGESFAEQERLFGVYEKEGEAAFKKAIQGILEKEEASKKADKNKKKARYSSRTAYKKMGEIAKLLSEQHDELKSISTEIGGDAKKESERILKKIEALIQDIQAVKR